MRKILGVVMILAGFSHFQSFADTCDDAFNSCVESSDKKLTECETRCDRISDDAIWTKCHARCDARHKRAEESCSKQTVTCANAQASEGEESFRGNKRTGKDGCYFGECPENLEESISETRRNPPPKPASVNGSIGTTSICQTPTFWCQMFVRGPVNQPCYCNSIWGPINGISISESR